METSWALRLRTAEEGSPVLGCRTLHSDAVSYELGYTIRLRIRKVSCRLILARSIPCVFLNPPFSLQWFMGKRFKNVGELWIRTDLL